VISRGRERVLGVEEERRVTRSRKQIETVTTSACARAGNADISAMARKRDGAEFARERGNFRWPKLLYGITSVAQLPCRRRYRRNPTQTRCIRAGPQLLRICRYSWQVARPEFHPSLPFAETRNRNYHPDEKAISRDVARNSRLRVAICRGRAPP